MVEMGRAVTRLLTRSHVTYLNYLYKCATSGYMYM